MAAKSSFQKRLMPMTSYNSPLTAATWALGGLPAPAPLLGIHAVRGEKHGHRHAQNRTCERLHRLVSPGIQ